MYFYYFILYVIIYTNILIYMGWAMQVARVRERRGVYRVLVGKPEGKKPLGRPRHRWEDNIKMDIQEVGCGGRLYPSGS